MNQTIIVGIAGASASGKSLLASTITEELQAELGPDNIEIIKEDSYYRDQSHLSMEQRVLTNYDHPEAFEHDLLIQQIKLLRQGQSVDVPVYDYNIHTRSDQTIRYTPCRVLLIEGILLFSDARLRELFDISIYMDTPLDICLTRRLQRDVVERGRTMDSVLKQYQQTVRPMFYEYIKPGRQFADVIVPKGGKNRIAIDLMKTRIKHLLSQ